MVHTNYWQGSISEEYAEGDFFILGTSESYKHQSHMALVVLRGWAYAILGFLWCLGRGHIAVLGIKAELAVCKANHFTPLLSLVRTLLYSYGFQ